MKIAVTATGRTPSVPIDSRFGRSPFFIIYDIDKDSWECIENDSTASASGAGISTAQMLAAKGVNAVITGNVGPNAMQALQAAGIDVYAAASGSVEQVVEMYKRGVLEKISTATVSSKHDIHPVAGKTARIAIATEGDYVSQHFGHCSTYTLVDIDNGHVKNKTIIMNPGHEPGFLPHYLAKESINYIIAGGMGTQAQAIFNQLGIKPILGVTGTIDEVIEAFVNDKLQDGESLCDH
ncbi:MAG: hypothetical protein PWQ93_1360 [Clostridiales bacterium]|nr:hypothetical protein [Clostridiales bacterium]